MEISLLSWERTAHAFIGAIEALTNMLNSFIFYLDHKAKWYTLGSDEIAGDDSMTILDVCTPPCGTAKPKNDNDKSHATISVA